jgi:large subunit ribosomal protein L7/L12
MIEKNPESVTGMSVEILEQKIAKQKERLKQLNAQKQAVLNREKKRQSEQQRKEDTRRKILLGSYLLKKMENEANKEKILADLNEYLTEDRDRKLFDL